MSGGDSHRMDFLCSCSASRLGAGAPEAFQPDQVSVQSSVRRSMTFKRESRSCTLGLLAIQVFADKRLHTSVTTAAVMEVTFSAILQLIETI